MKIRFMGSGGGRISTALSLRFSAGFIIEFTKNFSIYVDPGPHTPCAVLRFKPKEKIRAVFVSHWHLDHYTGFPWLLEHLYYARKIRKIDFVFYRDHSAMVEDFLYLERDGIARFIPLHLDSKIELKEVGVKVTPTPTRHTKEGIGFLFEFNGKRIWYSGDTAILEDHYGLKGLEVAILNVTFPPRTSDKPVLHMTLDQAIEFLKTTKPKVAVLTHFGRAMQNYLARNGLNFSIPGVKVIAARDGLEINFGETAQPQTLESFL